MSRSIDYGNLMHEAMRGLIRRVLQDVSDKGLPGNHHFFITFDTQYPDVELADWLSDRYPGEMTVVLQHRFDDLEVGEDGFAVTLSFGEAPERRLSAVRRASAAMLPSVTPRDTSSETNSNVRSTSWRPGHRYASVLMLSRTR